MHAGKNGTVGRLFCIKFQSVIYKPSNVCAVLVATLYYGILFALPAVSMPKQTAGLFWLFALSQHNVYVLQIVSDM